jgi:hypothetical protein
MKGEKKIDEAAYRGWVTQWIGTRIPPVKGGGAPLDPVEYADKDPSYDYRAAYKAGVTPVAWDTLPVEAQIEDVRQAFRGVERFPPGHMDYLRHLVRDPARSFSDTFSLFRRAAEKLPPVYYWPDEFKRDRRYHERPGEAFGPGKKP